MIPKELAVCPKTNLRKLQLQNYKRRTVKPKKLSTADGHYWKLTFSKTGKNVTRTNKMT